MDDINRRKLKLMADIQVLKRQALLDEHLLRNKVRLRRRRNKVVDVLQSKGKLRVIQGGDSGNESEG